MDSRIGSLEFVGLNRDVMEEIFSKLDAHSLNKVCLVCKQWKMIAEGVPLKRLIYSRYAFGQAQWIQHFGSDLTFSENPCREFEELPADIGSKFRRICPVFPKLRMGQTHILVRIPEGLTLNKLGSLFKKFFPKHPTGFNMMHPEIASEFGDRAWKKSFWVWMTKGIIPGTGAMHPFQQRLEIRKFSQISYDYPDLVPALAVILAKYVSSGALKTRLFPDLPKTMIYTKNHLNNYGGSHILIGNFSQEGLEINIEVIRETTTKVAVSVNL